MCIFYTKRDKSYEYLPILLNNKPLLYCKKFKYLGHCINNELNDNDDIMRQIGSIYGRGNSIINKFRTCTDDVKCILFKTYVSNFYMSQIWCNFNDSTYSKFKVAYNNIFRSLFNLSRKCSVSYEMSIRGIDTASVVQRKLIFSIYFRILHVNNELVKNVMNSDANVQSKLVTKWYKELRNLHV